jgi:glycosyltransferase involved in cell wall biosynthesis
VAARVAGVRVIDEPRRGLVVARETGRRAATGDILVYVDADCRAPSSGSRRSSADSSAAVADCAVRAVSLLRLAPRGRALIRAYDVTWRR